MVRRLILLIWVAGAALALTPPPQEYVLHFQPNSVAATDQINLGAAFTMEAWVFLEAEAGGSAGSVIMGKTNIPGGSIPLFLYALSIKGRKPSFAQSTGQPSTNRIVTGSSDLALSSWTHMAAVLDAGTMRLYVNGIQVASGASPGAPTGTQVPFGLGAAVQGGTFSCCSFPGALREVRVWSRALSAFELQTFAGQTLTGTEAGLIADWPLSQGNGLTVKGIGPQAAGLTIQGSATWAHTKLLDNGPYWEIQTLPKLSEITGTEMVVFQNADHRPDLLLAHTPFALDKPTSGPVLGFHNEGQRVFTPVKPSQPATMVWPRNSAVADFDGDGLEDAVVADTGFDAPPWPGDITRIFMQRSGEMKDETVSRLPPGPAYTHDVCAADVNRDGSPDIFFASLLLSGSRGPTLYLNDGSGHFKAANQLLSFSASAPPSFLSCKFTDVNRDGAPDLLLGAWWTSNLNVRDVLLLNDGKGNLRDVSPQSMPLKYGGVEWGTVGFAPADVNRDGWLDLIVSETTTDWHTTTLRLLINNRDGTFHDQPASALNGVLTDGYFDKGFAPDLNQDGWPDLIVSELGGPGIRLFQNMGGYFEDRTETLFNQYAKGQPGDFDGDGRMDIVYFDIQIKIAWGKNLWPAVAKDTPIVTSVNMAGGFQGIAQNGWIEIKGSNLAPESVGANGMTWEAANDFASGRMPVQLGGASVTVNGKPAFVYYVSATQLNVLAPIDATLGVVEIVVTSGGLASASFRVDMRAAAPSFPLFGSKYVVSTHADNSLVGPASLAIPGFPVTPAKPGETIVLYGFGFGLPSTTLTNGAALQSGRLPTSPVIQIGGTTVTVNFAGVISPGLYQFNVIVPSAAPDGDNAVSASYSGSTAPSGGQIAVKR